VFRIQAGPILTRQCIFLDEEIYRCREILSLTPANEDNIETLSLLGSLLLQRYYFGGRGHLEEAISILHTAFEALGDCPIKLTASIMDELGAALCVMYELTGDLAHGAESTSLHERTLELLTSADMDTSRSLVHLARIKYHFARSRCSERRSDYDRYMTQSRELLYSALQKQRDNENEIATTLCLLAEVLNWTGPYGCRTISDVHHDAFRLATESFRHSTPGHPSHISSLITYGHCASNLAQLSNSSLLLDDAVCILRRASWLAHFTSHPAEAEALLYYSEAVFVQQRHLGDSDCFEKCLTDLRRAAQICPEGHIRRKHVFLGLSAVYAYRFYLYADLLDLDAAISNLRFIQHDACSNKQPYRRGLFNLAGLLVERYCIMGRLNDLDMAADIYRSCTVPEPAFNNDDSRIYMSGLAHIILHKYEKGLVVHSDLDQVIDIFYELLPLVSETDDQAAFIRRRLACALNLRYLSSSRAEDLDRAISEGREALKLCRTDDEERPLVLNQLAICLRSEVGTDKVMESIMLHLDALATIPQSHRLTAMFRKELARDYRMLWTITRDSTNLELAIFNISRATRSIYAAPHERLLYAKEWTQLSEEACDMKSLGEAFCEVVNLLPRIIYVECDLESRIAALREGAGLAIEATFFFLRRGDLRTALTHLEQSRFCFWQKALQLRQTPQNVPRELENKFRRITEELELRSRYQGKLEGNDDGAMYCHKLSNDLERIIESIRLISPNKNWVFPPPFLDMTRAANSGYIVVLVPNKEVSYALIIQHILPVVERIKLDITLDDLTTMSTTLNVTNARSRECRHDRKMVKARSSKESNAHEDILKTLWISVVRPIVNAMKLEVSSSRQKYS
jgi:tetratricopeptide (TPR) repeat protein